MNLGEQFTYTNHLLNTATQILTARQRSTLMAPFKSLNLPLMVLVSTITKNSFTLNLSQT